MKKPGMVALVGLLALAVFVIVTQSEDNGDFVAPPELGATESGASTRNAGVVGDPRDATWEPAGTVGADETTIHQFEPTVFDFGRDSAASLDGSGVDAAGGSPGGNAPEALITRSQSGSTAVPPPSEAEFILLETDSEAIAFANACAFLELRGEINRLLQTADWQPRPDNIDSNMRLRLLSQGDERILLLGEAWLIDGDSYAVFDDEDLQRIFYLGERRRGSGSRLDRTESIRQRVVTYGYPISVDPSGCNAQNLDASSRDTP